MSKGQPWHLGQTVQTSAANFLQPLHQIPELEAASYPVSFSLFEIGHITSTALYTILVPKPHILLTTPMTGPHISIPRPYGGSTTFGSTAPDGRRSGLGMPRFFKRSACISRYMMMGCDVHMNDQLLRNPYPLAGSSNSHRWISRWRFGK